MALVITPLENTEFHKAAQRKRKIICISEQFKTLHSQYSSVRSRCLSLTVKKRQL